MTILCKTLRTKNWNDTKLSMSNLICFDPPFQLGLSNYSYQIHSLPLSLWFAPWQVCHCASLLHRCSHFHLESHPGEVIVLEASVGDQLQTIWDTVHILLFCNAQITAVSAGLAATQAEMTHITQITGDPHESGGGWGVFHASFSHFCFKISQFSTRTGTKTIHTSQSECQDLNNLHHATCESKQWSQ